MKKSKAQVIPDNILKQLVHKYYENPFGLVIHEEDQEDDIDLKLKEMQKISMLKNKDYDLYLQLAQTLEHPAYNVLIGIIDIAIFMLTLLNIEAFNQKEGSKELEKGYGRLALFIQVGLLSISMISQGIGIVGRGFRNTLKNILLTFDIIMTLISLILGMVLISHSDFKVLLSYSSTSDIFKIYCVVTVCKNLSVIKFLRRIRELRIVLDVLYKSTLFLMDLIGMLGIIMLLFSAMGISIFGGVINSTAISKFEELVGEELDNGMEFYNFNDYLNALLCLWSVILCGWQDFLRMMCFNFP